MHTYTYYLRNYIFLSYIYIYIHTHTHIYIYISLHMCHTCIDMDSHYTTSHCITSNHITLHIIHYSISLSTLRATWRNIFFMHENYKKNINSRLFMHQLSSWMIWSWAQKLWSRARARLVWSKRPAHRQKFEFRYPGGSWGYLGS